MISDEHRALIDGLLWMSDEGRSVSPEQYTRLSGDDNPRETALKILQESISARDDTDLERALTLLAVFGVAELHREVLEELAGASWHAQHETVIEQLGDLGDPRSVGALVGVALTRPNSAYPEEGDALARRAVFAIGRIPGEVGREGLRRLAREGDARLRREALRRLDQQ